MTTPTDHQISVLAHIARCGEGGFVAGLHDAGSCASLARRGLVERTNAAHERPGCYRITSAGRACLDARQAPPAPSPDPQLGLFGGAS